MELHAASSAEGEERGMGGGGGGGGFVPGPKLRHSYRTAAMLNIEFARFALLLLNTHTSKSIFCMCGVEQEPPCKVSMETNCMHMSRKKEQTRVGSGNICR